MLIQMSKVLKKSAPKKQKQEVVPPVEEPTVIIEIPPVVPEIPVDEASVEHPEAMSLDIKVKDMLNTISNLVRKLKLVESDLKNIRVLYQKEVRENNKRNKQKKPRKNGNTERHGFVREVEISDELAQFLKLPKGSLMARPQVTKAISLYVKEHNLANQENKTIFKADKDLKKLLGEPRYLINKKKPELGNGYSYFNLQTHLIDHFIKASA